MSPTSPADAPRETRPKEPAPGALYPWVKRASWFELALFTALVVFWLLPGFHQEEFVFGLGHGLGYVALCILIWIAILRHEAPYVLLAATLTPVGPVGSVIALNRIDRRPGYSTVQVSPERSSPSSSSTPSSSQTASGSSPP